MSYTIKQHELGYKYISPLPSEKELQDYYKNKYYQNLTVSTYQNKYSKEELELFKIDAVLSNVFYKEQVRKTTNLLDIACGEGYFMKYMQDLDWEVEGTDYSSFGIKTHNKSLLDKVHFGDLMTRLDQLITNKKNYDFINLGNILEHVVYPLELLNKCNQLLSSGGMLRVKVPNDFSLIQNNLIDNDLTEEYWVHPPDHLSYFNFDTLPKVLHHCNFDLKELLGDFPIEIFLLHPDSNYIKNNNGRKAHLARASFTLDVWIKGHKAFLEVFSNLAKAKISRSCIAFATKK